ncbi:MAG: alpha/beta hydrolase [Planctomycetes bacterium]|nr:alpha/beta hydrolase [Planctomycetota bacterium]
MRLRSLRTATLVGMGLLLAFTTVSGASGPKEFWNVWNGKKSTNLEKDKAVNDLIGGEELIDPYLAVLESDVWQYRATVIQRVQGETNEKLLAKLEEFLFDEKAVQKQPSAGEHLVWAMYNNQTWAKPEKWAMAKQLVMSKKVPDKVKARMLREMGVFRGATDLEQVQSAAKQNARDLVELLAWALEERKLNPQIRFLIGDALESLTSQDFGDDLEQWRFFVNNLKPEDKLSPRKADNFKDEFGEVELEGHSYSSPTPRPVEMEVLVLPNLYTSDQYWYPYIFQINKTFKCTFVKLPDCSKMKDIEWMKNRDGSENRTAYYYPLEQLVETFEQRRKDSKQKQVGLIAHGVSGWIALEYLRLHPESVAFAIIIGTWSGEQSYLTASNNCGSSKDEAYKWYSESLKYDPSGRTGSLAMNDEQKYWATTGDYKRRWADPKALEPIFYSTQAYRERPEGNARILVPKYEFDDAMKKARGKIDVPTLFIHGTQDPMYVKKDQQNYAKGFSKMTWAEYEDAAATPWAEQPVKFFEDFNQLLEKNDIIEKLKKQAEEDKKNGG